MEQQPAVDWKLCLKLANHKKDIAEELLTMLSNDLPIFKADINQAMTNGDKDILQQRIHKLHGACCYVGVPTLKTIVNDIETQLKTQADADVSSGISLLNVEAERVLEAIAEKSYAA